MTRLWGTADDILGIKEVQQGLREVPPVIEKIFKVLCEKSFSPEDASHIYLNGYILQHAVAAYFCDMYRLTIFRGIDADYHKQAAFLMKWIAKLRPVQIDAGAANMRSPVLLCNEYLAVAVGLIALFRSITASAQVVIQEADYISNLVHLLHFHSTISPEQLASELYQLEKRYR